MPLLHIRAVWTERKGFRNTSWRCVDSKVYINVRIDKMKRYE